MRELNKLSRSIDIIEHSRGEARKRLDNVGRFGGVSEGDKEGYLNAFDDILELMRLINDKGWTLIETKAHLENVFQIECPINPVDCDCAECIFECKKEKEKEESFDEKMQKEGLIEDLDKLW